MPTIRPVAHAARLSIVEHLDELRSRLIWVVATYVIAFAVCYSFNNQILDWLNRPLAAAKQIDCAKSTKSANPLERTACFDHELAKALKTSGPALAGAADSLGQLAAGGAVSAQTAAKVDAASQQLQQAADALERAAAAAPKPVKAGRATPITIGVTEPFLTTISVSAYAAALISLPMILFQLFAFVLPAFTHKERRLALPAMIAAPVLFLGGVAFGYFLALPPAIGFLQNYNDSQYDILVQARDYYRFVTILLAGVGLLFQVPLVVLAVIRLQILTPKQLRASRGYAILLFAIIAAVITPTPDPVTMMITMSPMVVLYELSIQLSRFIVPKGPSRWSFTLPPEEDEEDEDEPPAKEPEPTPRVVPRGIEQGDGLD